jgi:cytochrome P450
VVSTRTTTVNAFIDILGVGSQHDTYETLRGEAESILKSEDDWTNPASLKSMVNIDSALRESARKNPLQTRGLMKQVMPREGITLPDGARVPQGTWLGVPIEAIHRDEVIYSRAHEYDASRFTKPDSEGGIEDDGVKKNLDVALPSDIYMFFSYGRSAW